MKIDLDLLRKVAENAGYTELIISPRHCYQADKIEKGADPITVAMQDELDPFLGWEISGWYAPGRGDTNGPTAAFLATATPAMILALIDRIEELEDKSMTKF